jgi:hypothetical protein
LVPSAKSDWISYHLLLQQRTPCGISHSGHCTRILVQTEVYVSGHSVAGMSDYSTNCERATGSKALVEVLLFADSCC